MVGVSGGVGAGAEGLVVVSGVGVNVTGGAIGTALMGVPFGFITQCRSMRLRSVNTLGRTGLPLKRMVASFEFSTRMYRVSLADQLREVPASTGPLNAVTPSIAM